jgi:hypothetical protein
MRRKGISVIVLIALAVTAYAQKKAGSPSDTVISFYRALKEKRYVEGFRHSVYRNAVEGLTPTELQDLEPDFARTFAAIPDKIEPSGEQINGETATVFLKFGGATEPQQVVLSRVGSEWLVGDKETLALVNAQGRAFFFEARMLVNEGEVFEMLQAIVGAEILYSRKFAGKNATLPELVRMGGVPQDLQDGETSGYKVALTVSGDTKTFFVTASPVIYGKTGKVSFYADIDGVHGEDLKGNSASSKSPIYQPK